MELNRIYNEDCLEGMKRIPDGSVDMTVTSPPYDNLRSYNGNNVLWNESVWEETLAQLHRVTKAGGIVVWIVSDATIKGSETGTSFKQALYAKEIGFNLYDTMIWKKENSASIGNLSAYENVFEYMFVLSKGKPVVANIIKDKPNKRYGELQYGSIRQEGGETRKTSNYKKKVVSKFGRRHNVWEISSVKSKKERKGHPAQFPTKLIEDHIITWSDEGDMTLDPFLGSGTTAIACMNTNRNFIGFELDANYHAIALERIAQHERVVK